MNDIHFMLDRIGVVFDGADPANGALYLSEGDYKNAGISFVAAVPVVGSLGTIRRVSKNLTRVNETKTNSFTPIFTANKQFISLFLTRKEGTTTLGFESVKTKVFNDIMTLREKKHLKDYFEKQKLTADIKIVR